jgi:hypothetical protein
VSAATAAAAGVGILVWAISEFAGVSVPAEVQAALITIAVFAAGWLKTDPDRL